MPLAQVGTATVFFFFQAIVLVAFLLGFQYAPAWSYLPLLLFGLVDLIVFTVGGGDLPFGGERLLPRRRAPDRRALQAWFWGVPIIYSYNLVYDLFRSTIC